MVRILFKLAGRNILRHKGKSLVIGVILFLGAFLMTLGNGMVAGMEKGLRNNIINTFMGHLVIVSQEQKSDNVLFELYGKAVAPIHNFKDIEAVLKNDPAVDRFLPVGKNMAVSLNEESDPFGVFLLGVDFDAYQKMFPDNLKVIEGRLLKGTERGVLVPVFSRKEFYDMTSLWLVPENGKIVPQNLTPEAKENADTLLTKEDQVFWGSNEDNSTTDVRVGIKGIVDYQALNTFWGHFLILDIESYRESMGYFAAGQKTQELSPEKQGLLAAENENLDDLFTGDVIVDDVTSAPAVMAEPEKKETVQAPVDVDAGTYNLVFVKLKNADRLDQQAKDLETKLQAKNLGVRAITWEKGSGLIGSLAVVFKGFLVGFVAFLLLVASIIIINTLSMTALERISEIGMMRAVGAQKNFIRNMFIGETAILSGVFGLAGIALGALVVFVLPNLNITTDNDMLQLLYGGDTLRPVLNTVDIAGTVFELVVVTLISVIYPISIAQQITPLDAVIRD